MFRDLALRVEALAMLNTMGKLLDTRVSTENGARGRVLDAYFDEETWRIEYLLVELRNAGSSTRHLYPAEAIEGATELCRLREGRLSPPLRPDDAVAGLRSSREVLGCDVSGWTGKLGTTEDAVIEMESWLLMFLVVSAGSWCPEGVVLLQSYLVQNVEWEKRAIDVAVTHVEVLAAPYSSEVEFGEDGEMTAPGGEKPLH